MEEYKVIVLGSGISGISAAIYLKRAGIEPLIIENNIPGGQLNKIDIIENYPGLKEITGPDLSMNLLKQINDVKIEYNNPIEIDYNNKIVKLENKEYKYEYLIFATGRREKLLGLTDEEYYIGSGISLCATCDGALYKDKEVIVVGGGNSATSEALYLSNICKKVTIIYRKDNLRAEAILKERINNKDNIEILYNSTIKEYIIEGNKITGVKLTDEKIINCDCIFIAIGSVPNSELFTGLKENDYIIVNNKYETSIKDVYACGDVIKKELYQLITASSEGASVANNIIKKVNGSDNNETRN